MSTSNWTFSNLASHTLTESIREPKPNTSPQTPRTKKFMGLRGVPPFWTLKVLFIIGP